MIPLAPPDATMYWLSRRTRNDQFLLYCFAESTWENARLREAVGRRCAAIPELAVRLRPDPTGLSYPVWIPAEPDPAQFVTHRLDRPDWSELLAALGRLLGTGVDAGEHPWRLHVFRGIRDSPAPDPVVTVVVLQVSHALVDGRGASRIARALFTGSPGPGTTPGPRPLPRSGIAGRAGRAGLALPLDIARTLRRGLAAGRARTRLAELTAAGRVPPAAPGYPPGVLNVPGEGSGHTVRMLVCRTADFRMPGHSVTVVGLTVISLALQRYLRERGAAATALGAQVPMATPPRPGVRNNYRSLGVDLAIGEEDPLRRAAAIAADLAARRERAVHPLLDAQDAVTAALPALLLRRDVRNYPIDAVPERITGHTVVSSVDRGAADLRFGGAPVRFTAGFPAVGAVMHLTHGIHGLGDTVTLSLHADPAVVPDLDTYAALLRGAVRDVAGAG
ncbi:wax ester/triacylglycerol synthase domain-containing protein [Nocardia sp. NPDC004568]|uniref:wax ester/triacylglycerol synthase domain-containing protein n=1 Tax=Nocardia sp. NPDC004568 TaxID=3154551 RepID=UPI0033B78446